MNELIKSVVLCIWGTSPYTPVFFTLIENYDYVFSDYLNSTTGTATTTTTTDQKTTSSSSTTSSTQDSDGNLDWLTNALDNQSADSQKGGSKGARPLTVSFNPYRLVDSSSQTSSMMQRRSQRGVNDRFNTMGRVQSDQTPDLSREDTSALIDGLEVPKKKRTLSKLVSLDKSSSEKKEEEQQATNQEETQQEQQADVSVATATDDSNQITSNDTTVGEATPVDNSSSEQQQPEQSEEQQQQPTETTAVTTAEE
jgi:hypothetical protein